MVRKISILLTLIFSLLLAFALYLYIWAVTAQVDNTKVVIIEKGWGIKKIALQLKEGELISNAIPLEIYLAYFAKFERRYVIPGEYEVTAGLTGKGLVNKLIRGERVVRKLTIPEGYTNFQIFGLIAGNDALKGDVDYSLYKEGYLLPNTYHYYWGDSKQSLLESMRSAMENLLNALHVSDVQRTLTLASIVEKEAKTNEEKALVASVYLNRIAIGMPLQADPTVIYGIYNGNTDYRHILTRLELLIPTPYNTYTNKGLPPSPIANPGEAAIRAVLTAPATKYLYFVADGNGTHRFATSLAEHNRNVQLFRQLKH